MWPALWRFVDWIGRFQTIVQIAIGIGTAALVTKIVNATLQIGGLWLVAVGCGIFVVLLEVPLWAVERGWLKQPHQLSSAQPKAIPQPNLKTRRGYVNMVVIGNTGYRALVFEIGNDLTTGKAVGYAREIKAHITFFNEQHEKLEQVCPGYWDSYLDHDKVSIPAGESRPLAVIFADFREDLSSRYSHGIPLRGCKFIELILLDKDGNTVREEKFEFEKPLDRGIQVPKKLGN